MLEVNIKNCLVTGASGFLGSALCKELHERVGSVDVVSRSADCVSYGGAKWTIDLAREMIPASALNGIDTVFHLAGIAHASQSAHIPDSLYLQVNYMASIDLLEKSLSLGVKRFVYISSVKAGFDDSDMDVVDAYSKSKYLAEQAILAAAKKSNTMHIVVLRPCLIYGADVSGNLDSMIKGIVRGWFPSLPRNTGKRSMVSKQDVVAAMLLVAEDGRSHGQSYILADTQPLSAREVQQEIRMALGFDKAYRQIPLTVFKCLATIGDYLEKISGKAMPFNREISDKLFGSSIYSSEKISNELGWSPEDIFKDRVAEMATKYTI